MKKTRTQYRARSRRERVAKKTTNITAPPRQKKLRMPMPNARVLIGMLVAGIGVRGYLTLRHGALVAADRIGGYDWLVVLVGAACIAISAVQKTNQSSTSALKVAGRMGLAYGMVVSVLDAAFLRSIWSLINIIAKPLLLTLISAAACGMIYALYQRFFLTKHN